MFLILREGHPSKLGSTDTAEPVGCGKPQAHRIVRVVGAAIDAVRCAHHILRLLILMDDASAALRESANCAPVCGHQANDSSRPNAYTPCSDILALGPAAEHSGMSVPGW